MEGTILFPEPIYRLDFTEISSTYTMIAQIQHPSVIFLLQNLSDAVVTFSFDGINDHIDLPQNGFLLLDVSANKSLARPVNFQQGQAIYVKGAPTDGKVNLTSFYIVR
jgi:hypothetical protein